MPSGRHISTDRPWVPNLAAEGNTVLEYFMLEISSTVLMNVVWAIALSVRHPYGFLGK